MPYFLRQSNSKYLHKISTSFEGDFIKFYVKDEGIGIIKSKQEKIFDSVTSISDKLSKLYWEED